MDSICWHSILHSNRSSSASGVHFIALPLSSDKAFWCSMLAVIYMTLKQLATSNKAAVSGSGDALGDILDDFEGLI